LRAEEAIARGADAVEVSTEPTGFYPPWLIEAEAPVACRTTKGARAQFKEASDRLVDVARSQYKWFGSNIEASVLHGKLETTKRPIDSKSAA